MKVKELIQKLQQFDPEMVVMRDDYYGEMEVNKICEDSQEEESRAIIGESKIHKFILIS